MYISNEKATRSNLTKEGEMARIDVLRKLRELAEARNAAATDAENRVTPRRTSAKLVSIPTDKVSKLTLAPEEGTPSKWKKRHNIGQSSKGAKKHKAQQSSASVESQGPQEEADTDPTNILDLILPAAATAPFCNSSLSKFLEAVGESTLTRFHIPFQLKRDLPTTEVRSAAKGAIFNLIEAVGVLHSLGQSYYSGLEAKKCLDRMKEAEALRVEAQIALVKKEEDLTDLTVAYTSASKRANEAEVKQKAVEDALKVLQAKLDEALVGRAEVEKKKEELVAEVASLKEAQLQELKEREAKWAEFAELADVAFSTAVRQVIHRNPGVELNLNGIGVYYEFHGGHLYAVDRGQVVKPEDIPYVPLPLPENQSMELRAVSEDSERTAIVAGLDSPATGV